MAQSSSLVRGERPVGGGPGRNYGSGPQVANEPKQPPTYLQSTDNEGPSGMGPMFGPMKDPEASGPGKSLKRQDMGSVVGRRGAGSSQITGGDQGAHSIGHYGKKGRPPSGGGGLGGLVGGGLF